MSEKVLTRGDLEKLRSELSEELKSMGPVQRRGYLKAAEQVYEGLAKMTNIRMFKA